ncbi:MAG: transposase, partial [Phycisphaerales bacterium]|nr:transposase [Phycisphaerales bacterium]
RWSSSRHTIVVTSLTPWRRDSHTGLSGIPGAVHNRHCPKCQTRAKEQWLERQRAQLLPVPYFHVVFTLPHDLSALIRLDARALYGLLFDTAAQTLQEFAANPRWLGGTLGFTLVLHTWSQTLLHHPHVHGLVGGGALASDGHWRAAKPGFLFPVQALSRVFRGKYLDALAALRQHGELQVPPALTDTTAWTRLLTQLRQTPWVVYLKPPLSGPQQVLEYLARYTHRVALSNDRLVSVNAEEVCLRYRDRAHGNARRLMRLHHTSSCAASCCMCYPRASSAFAITVSPPIAARPPSSLRVAPRSMRRRLRHPRPNRRRLS